MIHIYTGEGKGKTTAALGLVLRALGADKKVALVQFMKKGDSSEFLAIKKYHLPLDTFSFGIGFYKILNDPHSKEAHRKVCAKALRQAEKIIIAKKHDLIILDEINVACALDLVKVEKLIKLLKKIEHQTDIDIVLTGRNAPASLKKMADLITNMHKEKHYFEKGIKAKRGIEY